MTWLDARRVAFGVPPQWRGFLWIDPATGERGQLTVGEGRATRALARAPRSGRLVFLTEEDERVVLWMIDALDEHGAPARPPRRLAEVTMHAARAVRQPLLAWSHDERLIQLYDGPTGERWKVDAATGGAELAPPFELPRGGGFTRVNELFSLADQLIVETVTTSADVYVSAPRGR
jgi:hypothetical protein